MKFTRAEAITIGMVVLTAILSVVGHMWIREMYRADLRFEPGDYYRSGTTAVTSLRLHNFGRETATGIDVQVAFPVAITEITGSPTLDLRSYSVLGSESRVASVRVDRLVPGATQYLYFGVRNPDGPITPEYRQFVGSVTHDGGQGLEGVPVWTALRGSLLQVLASLVLAYAVGVLVALRGLGGLRTRISGLEGEIDGYSRSQERMEFYISAVERLHEAVAESFRGNELPAPIREAFARYKERSRAFRADASTSSRMSDSPEYQDQSSSVEKEENT